MISRDQEKLGNTLWDRVDCLSNINEYKIPITELMLQPLPSSEAVNL